MAGYRPSHSNGLRLVSLDDRTRTHLAGDERPVVLHAVGTPRERLLLSPIILELRRLDVARQLVVAAGDDDEDATLNGVPDLALADRRLALGEPTPTHRLAALLAAYEDAIDEAAPQLVVIAGAGDAGLAAGLAAAKRGIAVAHVESGVRHGDARRDDLHRILNDRLADTLLAPTCTEAAHLAEEGIPDTRVHVVGQTDVDLLRRMAPRARARRLWAAHDLPDDGYVLVAVAPERLASDGALADALDALAQRWPVALLADLAADRLLDQLSLVTGAGAVVTDAGLVQDLTSALGVACHTLGEHTDRPHTLAAGTNRLVGDDPAALLLDVVPSGRPPCAIDLPPWDGRSAKRAARVLIANYVLVNQRTEVAVP
jgi:UDP-N-acetylglucosamine 2-epimerase (non-hydrolysing)